MKALKFDIGGKYAFFKNPENNKSIEVTYEHITKPHLLGILGCIVGLKGRQHHRKLGYIEYYEEFKGAMVSIVPHQPQFRKHIDDTTNTTGFTNKSSDKKSGATLTLRRQYLNNPMWTIYIQQGNVKDQLWNRLCNNVLKGLSVYPVYLGQTGCFAEINNTEIINLEDIELEDIEYCSSLFEYKLADIEIEKGGYLSKLMLPIGLNEKGLYIKQWLGFTDNFIEFSEGNFKKYAHSILNFI